MKSSFGGCAALVGVVGLLAATLVATPVKADEGKVLGGDAYPLKVCVVSGKALDSMGGPVDHEYQGRTVKFCCKGCIAKFDADPASYMKKLDEAIIARQSRLYPLDVCPISGEKLGTMGEPVNHIVGNRLVRLCCKGCVKSVDQNPEKVIAKLNAAVVAKQLPDYPVDVCVVSGEKLGEMGEPVSYVWDNRLVRFCCKGCVKEFEKDPEKYLAKLDKAGSGSDSKRDAGHGGL